MTEQEKLMRRVQATHFALFDAGLFLNTHPTCAEALTYYERIKAAKNQAQQEYVSKFGPLSSDDVPPSNSWTWVDAPWPWERGN
mgnify:CR=1 FL=1